MVLPIISPLSHYRTDPTRSKCPEHIFGSFLKHSRNPYVFSKSSIASSPTPHIQRMPRHPRETSCDQARVKVMWTLLYPLMSWCSLYCDFSSALVIILLGPLKNYYAQTKSSYPMNICKDGKTILNQGILRKIIKGSCLFHSE